MGTKIESKELLYLIGKNTDIDLLLSYIVETYFKNNGGDDDEEKSVFLDNDTITETIENILLSINYQFPEKLESTIKKLPLRLLNKLLRDSITSKSIQLNKIYTIIDNSYTEKINSIKGILPPNIKVTSVEQRNSSIFEQTFEDSQVLLGAVEQDSDRFEQLFSIENLAAIASAPISKDDLSDYVVWSNDGLKHIEAFCDVLTVPREVISKYVNLKNYPKLHSKKFFKFSIYLIAVKKKNEFYWLLRVITPERANQSEEFIKEKSKFEKELESRFKLQNKKVDFIIGTEEKIIEELKQRFSKEVK
jgi:hypothetical protein